MKRKHLSIFSSILAVFLLPSLVLAATIPWVIDTDGNLTISESGKHYHVTQSNNAPVSNWIKVNDGVKTTITLDGVQLSNMDHNSIDLGNHKDTKTTIILKGENSLIQRDPSNDVSALRIADGTLRIEGDGKLEASTKYGEGNAAAIGSNDEEAMQGTIQVAGKAQIAASSISGAGIGSGHGGEMSGTIQITEQARVATNVPHTAGIGAGGFATMSGEIEISGQAQMNAEADKPYSVGLGAKLKMSGKILVTDQAQVNIKGMLGIGSPGEGFPDDFMSGSIRLQGDAKVNIQSYSEIGGIGIGTFDPNYFLGKIEILDRVQLINQKIDGGGNPTGEPATIGGGGNFSTDNPQGHYKISTEATINGIKAENAQVLVGNKLVNIHMKDGKPQNYEAVKPEPEPEPEPPKPPTPPAPKKVVQLPTLVGLRTLRAGRVSVGPVGPKTTGLVEEATSAFSSLEGPVLYQGKLHFVGEDPAQAFVLSFHLGSDYAGKSVQVQQFDQGQVKIQVLRVSESGLASVPVRTLGDFAVTVQP